MIPTEEYYIVMYIVLSVTRVLFYFGASMQYITHISSRQMRSIL